MRTSLPVAFSTTALNETLDKLEKIEYSKENEAAKRYASNVLLATNMISVGIDVARLNVMLMIGQPKLTSEYIQASSRVGRSFPGVVFVQYDATKSRDRSTMSDSALIMNHFIVLSSQPEQLRFPARRVSELCMPSSFQ